MCICIPMCKCLCVCVGAEGKAGLDAGSRESLALLFPDTFVDLISNNLLTFAFICKP